MQLEGREISLEGNLNPPTPRGVGQQNVPNTNRIALVISDKKEYRMCKRREIQKDMTGLIGFFRGNISANL